MIILFFKMDKIGFVRNGVIMRLPPGFRFCPTDEELVVEYLKRKVFYLPLPASVIPEFDVCKSDPWDLPGDKVKDRYFFSPKQTELLKGKRSSRATDSGYWKATGKDKKIISSKTKQVVGMKKTLIFYKGKAPRGSKTYWIMHEYCLVDDFVKVPNNVLQKMNSIQNFMENWVVCRISMKKRSSKDSNEPVQPHKCNPIRTVTNTKLIHQNLIFNDNIDLNLSPSTSGSSGVTEIPNCELDGHEESSS